MTSMAHPMLREFHEEAAVMKRVLERVQPDKLSWKPHAKSMTLGQLAVHIATVPRALARITQEEAFDVSLIGNLRASTATKCGGASLSLRAKRSRG